MVTFSMTLTNQLGLPGFQGHGIFVVEYLKNYVLWKKSYYSTLIGNYIQSIE